MPLIFRGFSIVSDGTGRIQVGRRFSARYDLRISIASNARIKMGDDVFFNNSCSINALEEVVIGDRCLFGEGVKIYDHNHRFREQNTPIAVQGFVTGSILIENDCWLGSNVVVLKGVRIGHNSVIGAGVVLSDDVPPFSIVKVDSPNGFIYK